MLFAQYIGDVADISGTVDVKASEFASVWLSVSKQSIPLLLPHVKCQQTKHPLTTAPC